ncbi:MAG: dephospho-CoA kinase [Pseudomonadota bacterium]
MESSRERSILSTFHLPPSTFRYAGGLPVPVIAITGGIGSGKSTVRRIFEDLGAYGIDTDELARQVVEPGTEGARQLLEAFGPGFFDADGRLDRKKMAEEVFTRPESRTLIESILHPLIRKAEKELIKEVRRQNPDVLAVVEIPLLAEGGRAADYDSVVLVTAPENIRISRLVASGRYSRNEARARMVSQVGDIERKKFADWIVDNGFDPDETLKQVKLIYSKIAPDP